MALMTEHQIRIRDAVLERARNERLIMGVLNVTPDSFSDGGAFDTIEAAGARARQMVLEGADILDIGGESTRPGADHVSAEDEIARTAPVIRALVADMDTPVSIDTYKAETAYAAVNAGAVIINDISGMTFDPAMADCVAKTGAIIVVTYHRGKAEDGIDLVADMQTFFGHAMGKAERAGIPAERIWIDPGVGFAKSIAQNFEVIHHLDTLKVWNCPVLVGFSRKSFIGKTLDRTVDQRLAGTLSSHLFALAKGASIFRVHDVVEHRDALTIYEALEKAAHV